MTAKINQPSPQIFSSDPLEQIYAKSVMDPTLGGLAYMFANALGERRRMDQDTYMRGVSESNQIAGRVAQQELAAKQEQEMIKGALKLLELGQSGASMPVLQKIIQSGNLNEGSDINRRLIEASIVNKMRDPSGGGGGVEVTAEVGQYGPGGVRIKGRGAGALDQVNKEVQNQLQINKDKGYNFDPAAASRFAMDRYQR
jgi:hypothetical protein